MLGDLHTIGHMTARLQRAPAHIERIIAALGIEPTLTLNGLAYFSVADESRIDGEMRREQAERLLGRPLTPAERQV
jgi:hypothetical protein